MFGIGIISTLAVIGVVQAIGTVTHEIQKAYENACILDDQMYNHNEEFPNGFPKKYMIVQNNPFVPQAEKFLDNDDNAFIIYNSGFAELSQRAIRKIDQIKVEV